MELIVITDGLKGFPEAISAVFPEAMVQTCIVQFIRNSLAFVSYKDRKLVVAELKTIYRAENAEAAERALSEFENDVWSRKYSAISQSWRRHWSEIIPFFVFPHEVRRIIYTTNAIESLNSTVRWAVRTRGHFPNDEAATKLIYLVLHKLAKDWKMPSREWYAAKAQFAVMFADRMKSA